MTDTATNASPRPAADRAAAAALPSTSALADVLALRGQRGWLTPPVVAVVGTDAPVSGAAVTIALTVGRPGEGGPGLRGIYDVLSSPLHGKVVVIGGAWPFDGCVWGEILTHAALQCGAAAVVVDGRVRDVEAMRHLGLPVYARGTGIAGPQGLLHLAGCGLPVDVAGQCVSPGDQIVLDGHGAVHLAADDAAGILAAARRYDDGERQVIDRLGRGEPLSSAYSAKSDVIASIRLATPAISIHTTSPSTQGE